MCGAVVLQMKDEKMVRYGQTLLDPPHTQEGRMQAHSLRDKLFASNMRFHLVVVSPLRRAMESAHIAFHGLAGRAPHGS